MLYSAIVLSSACLLLIDGKENGDYVKKSDSVSRVLSAGEKEVSHDFSLYVCKVLE